MARSICPKPGCPNLTPCTTHARPNANARGYNNTHQKLRAAWQRRIDDGEHVTCWRPDCDTTITGRAWHLGHDDYDRAITRGPECIPCNLGHAGRSAHR